MPSFEILADIFTCLSVFDSPKGSSNTVKTGKKYQPVFQKKAPNNIYISLVMLSIKEVKPLDLFSLILSGYQSGFFFCQISLSSVVSVSVSL